jgi:hypothetical protein
MERWVPVLRCCVLSSKGMRRCRMANDKNYITQRLEMDGKILSTKHTATKQSSWGQKQSWKFQRWSCRKVEAIPLTMLHLLVKPMSLPRRPLAQDDFGALPRSSSMGGQQLGIPACENETGEEVMRKIHIRFGRRKFKQYLNEVFLLRSEAVFVGNISSVSLTFSMLFTR